MQTAEMFEKEKLEVETLLASGVFSRAPNLAHLLKYVCAKYFEGAADEIKEYNIAVEALGRRPEFDQKRDSIVRVEAHRLRKGCGIITKMKVPVTNFVSKSRPASTLLSSLLSISGGTEIARDGFPRPGALLFLGPAAVTRRFREVPPVVARHSLRAPCTRWARWPSFYWRLHCGRDRLASQLPPSARSVVLNRLSRGPAMKFQNPLRSGNRHLYRCLRARLAERPLLYRRLSLRPNRPTT